MRPFFLQSAAMLSLFLFAAPSASAWQRVEGGAGVAGAAGSTAATVAADAGIDGAHADGLQASGRDAADADDATAPKSGFGQVMSVLTGLLQDAAQREATGRGDGFALDNPAIEISVTPVAGRTSLLRPPARARGLADGRGGTSGEQLAGGTPR